MKLAIGASNKMCLPKDKSLNLQHKAIACASSFGSTFVKRLTDENISISSLTDPNKHHT
jgi:hypothetical protein